jgi:hypothetical protein
VPLARTLGIDNVLKLLDSGALQLELDPTQIIQVGQMSDGPTFSTGAPPLPLLSYRFTFLRAAQYNDYLVRCLQDVRRELYGYTTHDSIAKLEGAILRALQPVPGDSGLMAINGHLADLRANTPVLKKAVAMRLRKVRNIEVPESEIEFSVTQIDEASFRAESNLVSYGISEREEHNIIEVALLANGGLNSRIEDMNNYRALSGFIDDELPLFSGKLEFLADTLSPGELEKTFDRVVKIRKLPSLDLAPPDRLFDMEKFLEVRESKECTEFREWLRRMRSATDEEIDEKVNAIRAKFGTMIQGNTGKGIRIVIATAVGLIPILGAAAGAILSTVDSYLLEKVFPSSGPMAFLSRQYSSLFSERCAHGSEN